MQPLPAPPPLEALDETFAVPMDCCAPATPHQVTQLSREYGPRAVALRLQCTCSQCTSADASFLLQNQIPQFWKSAFGQTLQVITVQVPVRVLL